MTYVLLGSSVLAACQPEKSRQTDEEEQPPNIIFIMSDDHAFQAISAYGGGLLKTPNIYRLANEGMRFNRSYVTNSISAPSRAVALTGKFSHINGVRGNAERFDSTQTTFPKLLQQQGYQTAVVGKWHLKTQPTGFDFWKVLPGQGFYYNPEFRTAEGLAVDSGYVTDLITDEALQWLESARKNNQPFMLMYQHKAPHREWWPALQDIEEFTARRFPEPNTLYDTYANRGRAAREAEMRISDHMGLTNDNKIRPEIVDKQGFEEFISWYRHAYMTNYARLSPAQQAQWDAVYGPINEAFDQNPPEGKALTAWKFQRYMQDYLASIHAVDRNIGRLLDYLDETGLAENTLVVYTSDQGFYLGEHGWFDKRFMYEESFRTPLLMRWPGVIAPGTESDALVQNLDWAETLLDAAGAAIPGSMQGHSLLPLMQGDTTAWRDALYYHYYEYPGIHAAKRHYGVATERYKLIHFYYDIDEWELYDLKADPKEMVNRFADPAYADIQSTLMHKLDSLQQLYGDTDSLRRHMLQQDTVTVQ